MPLFRRVRVVVPIPMVSAAGVAGCGSSASPSAKNASASSSNSGDPKGCATATVGTVSFRPGDTSGIQGWGNYKNLWDSPELKAAGVCHVKFQTFEGGPLLAAAVNKTQAAIQANAEANANAYYAWDATATGDPISLVKLTAPLSSNITAQPFTSKGLTILNALNQFLVEKKLSKGLVNINAWEVPNP